MLKNPYRRTGLEHASLSNMPWPTANAAPVRALLKMCPVAHQTPLTKSDTLAAQVGCSEVWIKDERARMGLGSFKALGAAFAIAQQAPLDVPTKTALSGRVFVAASAGNHGLSVAAGARVFGARSIIYLAQTVPEAFADQLRAKGAEVVRAGEIYEDSMSAAQAAADENDWTLISDSSWEEYSAPAFSVMQGYTVLADETVSQMPEVPTHIFLQAGVGGLAAAVAAVARSAWGDAPQILVVEPKVAPALHDSIVAGAAVDTVGPVSSMGRLDCKTPSLIALKGLSRDADGFILIDEDVVEQHMKTCAEAGFETSPSGGAGIAALLSHSVTIPKDARVLCILSEGAV